jgi:hypothetical protein
MDRYGELTSVAIDALNKMNGVASQVFLGNRLASLKLSASGQGLITLGTDSVPITLATYAVHGIEAYTTCASTDADNSVESVYVKSTMTGAAGVGGRARFHTYTNVALGGWCNALKGYMEFGASGSATGLGSSIVAETILSAGTSSGTYTALEAELGFGSAGVCGTRTSFLYCNTAGSARTTFDTSGVFLHMGAGITAAATKFCSATYQTLKCYFDSGSATRYLFFSQIEDGISLGNSTTAQTHTAGTPLFQIYSTCSSGASEPFYVKSTMTGTGGTGGRSRFHLYTNEAQGGWANALKAFTEFGAAGRITGLASCYCADLELSVGTTQGTYTVYEANIIADAAISTGTQTSFMRCNIDGTDATGKGTLNSNVAFLALGENITVGTNDDTAIVTTIAGDDAATTHQLRAKLPDGTDIWFKMTTDAPSS